MAKNNSIHDVESCNHLFSCDEDWNCDCSSEHGCDECNDDWESEESVADGLGFEISDDGHWVPKGY